MHCTIKSKLQDIEASENVRILWAVESGSRSWGFESPDSDYDVRFIYAHRPDWYLSVDEQRDVIELPADDLLDISGWDLRKTLRLFKKSNPVLTEWLVAPLVYMCQGRFRNELLAMAADCFSRRAYSYHYFRMADNNYRRYVQPKDPVNLKKYFYVLRPLLNIAWLRDMDSVPPMRFAEAVAALQLPWRVRDAIDKLLALKEKTAEIGKGPRVPVLEQFIQSGLESARIFCEQAPVGHVDAAVLDQLFRQTLHDTWQSPQT